MEVIRIMTRRLLPKNSEHMLHTFQQIIKILGHEYRRRGFSIIALMLISMGLEIIGVSLVVPLIAFMVDPSLIEKMSVLSSFSIPLSHINQTHLVIAGMSALVGFYLLKTVFMMYAISKQTKFVYNVASTLSQQLFTYYLKQPWAFYLKHHSAHLSLKVTSDPNMFITNALRPTIALISEVMVLIGIGGFLLIIHPIGTIVVATSTSLCSWLYLRMIKEKILNYGKTRYHNESMRLQCIQEGFGGAKNIILLGRETEILERHQTYNLLSTQSNEKVQTFTELPRLGLEFFAVFGLSLSVIAMSFYGANANTEMAAIVPTLALYAAAAFRIMPSANRIVAALQSIRYGCPVVQSLYDELELLKKSKRPIQPKAPLFFARDITLKNLYYRYEPTQSNVLTNINLTIKQGTATGFIGTSGAGKSTLIDLILGLLVPTNGHITVDDIDIQTNLRGWQDKIGYIPQSIYLADDSLLHNVAFGLSNDAIDLQAVQRAIKTAQLETFVNELPQGLDTFVGEHGLRLSGGQRQRIGIARALYHDPELLVLDEATSALDIDTEKEIMDAVYSLQKNKTVVIIAHRFSTIANCSYVYRMEKGAVVAQGSFSHVMQAYKSHNDQSVT
ncbi:MAG: ABC transporter ATP-binding protein/permease [Gammaproteobacteria bacterium]|nr:ABC transporter ATP-binding protein/permease [Gammaproteobacteria bacterium]